MSETSVAFIGAGNMAGSLIGGLLARGWPAESLRVSDPAAQSRDAMQAQGVQVFADNGSAISGTDVVVLAVKPQVLEGVCRELGPQLDDQLVVSIAAGVESQQISRWLGGDPAVVRCMPNTPALVQQGASILYGNRQVSGLQRQLAEGILAAVGLVCWVETEEQLHAGTALSGCGPAYFFLFMEAIREAAVELGLNETMATELIRQTALGAAVMVDRSSEDLVALRRQVTSPGGVTEQAIAAFEAGGLRELVRDALAAADRRSRELAAGEPPA